MRGHWLEEVTAWMAYFGALLIPVAYVLFSGFRGRLSQRMLIAGGAQFCLAGLFVLLGSRPGNPEAFLWAGPMIVLNLVSLVCYFYLLLKPERNTNDCA